MTRFSSATTRTRNCAISVCIDSGAPRPDRLAVLRMVHRGPALPRFLCAGAHKRDHARRCHFVGCRTDQQNILAQADVKQLPIRSPVVLVK
jgi:hypothetical protein